LHELSGHALLGSSHRNCVWLHCNGAGYWSHHRYLELWRHQRTILVPKHGWTQLSHGQRKCTSISIA
jgi:hypothetical protein